MGTISHNAIIVTVWNNDKFQDLLSLAKTLFKEEQISVQGPVINSYRTLFIGPDGSKEGWDESDRGDENREKYIEQLKLVKAGFPDWLEVKYGELGFEIVRGSHDGVGE